MTPCKIERGTVIGTTECAGCGAEKELKVNAAGCVYYFCANVLERDENGKAIEKCFTRYNLGRSASQKLINEYLNTEGQNKNVEQDQIREAENRDTTARGNPEPTRTTSGGGIAAGLKHFLTGDE